MSKRSEEAAYTELEPDAWHQNDEGNYYIDCPECGSAATLMNVVKHGRCNGYLSKHEEETELDEEAMDCTAKLWFELGYVSDPEEEMTDDAVGESKSESSTEDDGSVENEAGVPASDQPPGSEGTVDDDQQ